MCPIRVLHKIERLSQLHQPIDQLLISLEMYIVVAGAMGRAVAPAADGKPYRKA